MRPIGATKAHFRIHNMLKYISVLKMSMQWEETYKNRDILLDFSSWIPQYLFYSKAHLILFEIIHTIWKLKSMVCCVSMARKLSFRATLSPFYMH